MDIKNKAQFIEYFSKGIKDLDQLKIGVEHERFLFEGQNRKRISYPTLKKLFENLKSDGWKPLLEKENISPNEKELSKNGSCSWMEVECLGACVSAPMMQVNEDYYEDLNEKTTKEILISLIKDNPLKPGSYRGRKNTSPEKIKISNGEKHA